MRWSRPVLLVLLTLGLGAAGLGACYGMPIWAFQWLPWVAGCFLLRRGKVLGAVLLLATSAALLFTGWGTKELFLRLSDGPVWIAPWRHPYPWAAGFLGLAGAAATLTITRPLWRIDALATACLLAGSVSIGLGGAMIYGTIPKFLRCPRGTVEIGPVRHAWYWLHRVRWPHDLVGRFADGKRTEWLISGMGDFCIERPSDGTGRVQVWKTFGSYENDRRREDDRLVRSRGVRHSRGHLVDNKPHGTWTVWFESGATASSGRYHGGEKMGRWTYFHENGRRLRQGDYRYGKRDGLWRCWWPSGQLLAQGRPCVDVEGGLRCGPWSFWNQDGSPALSEPGSELCAHPFEVPLPILW